MLYQTITSTALCVLLFGSNTSAMPGSPAQQTSRTPHQEAALTTPPPSANELLLLKRQQSSRRESSIVDSLLRSFSSASLSAPSSFIAPSVAHSQICGYSPDGQIGKLACGPGFACAATIYPDGDAYHYCSQPGNADPEVVTTGYSSWMKSDGQCPVTAVCCNTSPYTVLYTEYITASGFTVTGFNCHSTSVGTTFYEADSNVINPSFSASLAQATASSTSRVPGNHDVSSKNGNNSTQSSRSSNVGIGAAIGVAIGLLLIAVSLLLCWLYQRKRKQHRRLAKMQGAYTSTDYDPAQVEFYRQQNYPSSPQELHSKPSYPSELSSGYAMDVELPASGMERHELPAHAEGWRGKNR